MLTSSMLPDNIKIVPFSCNLLTACPLMKVSLFFMKGIFKAI